MVPGTTRNQPKKGVFSTLLSFTIIVLMVFDEKYKLRKLVKLLHYVYIHLGMCATEYVRRLI